MPDHININHPDSRERWMRHQREIARLRADLDLTTTALMDAHGDLDAIFTRIARGAQVELHYPDGTVVPIARVREPDASGAEE